MTRVLEEVHEERVAQVQRGWTPEHDDRHTVREWGWLIGSRLVEMTDPWGPSLDPCRRRLLVEIAALAVAAVEAIDRDTERLREQLRDVPKGAA